MFQTDGSTLNKIALSLFFVCLGAMSNATWSTDDTQELKNELASIYGSSTGRLQAKTYYVRGQIKIGDTGGGFNQYRQYIMGFPSGTGPVYIQGHTLSEGSAAPIDRLQTRIVHGVIVGDDDAGKSDENKEIKPYSVLPAGDPWKDRFIRANTSKLYWIEFPAGEGARFQPQVGSHTYLTFDIFSKKNWPTATYRGIPLHYAEAIADSNNDFYRWTWAQPDTATCWFQQNTGTSGTPVPTDLSYLESVDWTNDYTWGLTFHGWDANCGMTKVDSVTSTLDEDLNDWTWQSEINFTNSPWNASTGGTNTDFSKVRRVTLMNAPEFLKNDYDMVFNPETGRIYFLAPTASVNRNGGTAPDINLEPNKYLEVAWPYKADQGDTISWGSPLVIGNGDATQSRQVIIKDIAFGTGRAMALDMQRMEGTAANPIKIENCRFRNQGHVGVSLWRCKNVKIDGCSFEDGLRGHLKIDAGRDFTKPYVASSSPPISNVKDLVSDGIIVTNSGFYNGGLMWPYNGTVEMANWNIGTEISHNTFDNLSGIAVRIHGAKNLVSQNTVTDCVQDITDYGAIYCGRSLVQLGNDISGNQITGVKWRGRTSQTKTPNSLEDDVCGVYVDDYMCGTTVGENLFSDCQTAIMSNGGRFNLFYRNWFDSSVDYVLRTNVARGTKGGSDAYAVGGTFRFWDEADFYKRSIANQLYSELRNLYMAVKAEYPTGEFFENTAWTAVFATGAYQISYHPVGEPDTKDLKHLVQRLNHETVGKPDWKTPDATAIIKDNGKNSLRRIQYTGVEDWFKFACDAAISGVPDRKWLVNYDSSNVTILKNYGNAWVWCTDNFADLSKRPVTQHRVFFRSYRDSQPGTADYMADEVGYYSFEVPNTNGQD